MASTDGLLRLGVEDLPLGHNERFFNIGGLGVHTNERLFSIEHEPVAALNSREFDILGAVRSTNEREFDMGASWISLNERLFSIVREMRDPIPGVVVTQTASTVTTTLSAPSIEDANTITVADASPFPKGTLIDIDGEVRLVEDRSGSTLTLSAPLAESRPTGTEVGAVVGFRPAIMVFSKRGRYIGAVYDFAIVDSPSRLINGRGSMTFYVPRNSRDIVLLQNDRLVAVQTELGDPLWVGTMNVTEASEGVIQVQCEDAFQLMEDGHPITVVEEVADNTKASYLYGKVVDLMNNTRGLTYELEWSKDMSGSAIFRGDIDFEGSPLAAIEEIQARSNTEYMWRASVLDPKTSGHGHLRIWLVVRDKIQSTSAREFFDGPDGNIMAPPRIIQDMTPVINHLRVRGRATDITKYLPDWAHWAAHDIEPEVTVSAHTGDYRRRADLNFTVDWSLSKAQQRALANKTLDQIWDLYRSYLRAIHDMEGRPFHEGWRYEGTPDVYEPKVAGKDSLSRRAWKTRRQLLETTPGTPASGVMVSESGSQLNLREWLIVRYNRATGDQTVHVYAIPLPAGGNLIKWSTTGPVTRYEVSGQRVVDTAEFGSGTGAFVAPYSVKMWWPARGQYITLRQLINGPFALQWWINPADPNNVLTDLGPEAALNSSYGGSSFISKVYGFEAYRIRQWDPRRDGIGELSTRRTAWYGGTTTRPRWRVTSFDVGTDAQTSLDQGIDASEIWIEVQSALGFPGEAAFEITVDEDEYAEHMKVNLVRGAFWRVQRGIGGTTARIHEAGAPVIRRGGEEWDGFEFPWTWPEGRAYAEDLLAKLSQPKVIINLRVANVDDLWSNIQLGSTHPVNIQSEGRKGGWVGDVRVIGYAVDGDEGELELVLEYEG